ncbi:GDSL-type esterase/lipase family protein [Pantanalinema rosaneae CENA516]|uniref:GDSL-type esterase/lipase family protein n=1 Tax=Pantanalinema rosaneae TaxID=1620701 RepID=UPI003D6F48B2
MTVPFVLALTTFSPDALNSAIAPSPRDRPPAAHLLLPDPAQTQSSRSSTHHQVRPDYPVPTIEFSPPMVQSPRSGSQLFYQRLAALQSGRLYTRLPLDSFRAAWAGATRQPTYEEWRWLMTREAAVVARGQGDNRLGVLVGDSLSLWFPSDRLPSYQLWLNQGLSGDTTDGILRRLPDFANTRPDVIYVMAGVNDLKHGRSDSEILGNLRQMIYRLQQTHPQADIIVQSILPTRSDRIPGERIGWLNQQLATIVGQSGATYLDVYSAMADEAGYMRPEMTTDGIHLSPQGYATWQTAILQQERWMANR